MIRLSEANRYRHLTWLIDLIASPSVQNPISDTPHAKLGVLKGSPRTLSLARTELTESVSGSQINAPFYHSLSCSFYPAQPFLGQVHPQLRELYASSLYDSHRMVININWRARLGYT